MADLDAIIFDFDGVLLESEFEGNRQLAELLTDLGHQTSVEEAIDQYIGLAGPQFVEAIERRIGATLPAEFHERRKAQSIRALQEGVAAVVGAVEFVRALPPSLPKAVASSSSTRWLHGHLAHLGLTDAFGPHVYSGRVHVERGKPEPDLYIFAAEQLGADIRRSAIIEDSAIGATGALASGARVIGFAGASHCREGHVDMLRGVGVTDIATSFDKVARLLGLDQPSR
jgi:HAD superfamily hydrolase (TIGR01509 family)